jgi:hypothetical protein
MKKLAKKGRGLGRMAARNEQPRVVPMPADVREFIVSKLAEILLLDIQQYPKLPEPTVAEGRVSHRTLRLVESSTQAADSFHIHGGFDGRS